MALATVTVMSGKSGSGRPGYHTAAINAGTLASVLHMYRLQADQTTFTHSLMITENKIT
jgi:hypothetical protein